MVSTGCSVGQPPPSLHNWTPPLVQLLREVNSVHFSSDCRSFRVSQSQVEMAEKLNGLFQTDREQCAHVCLVVHSVLCCDFRAAHVEEQEKKPQKNEKMKQKVRRHHTSKSDEPDLQESAFLKKIIAYQRKLLVQDSSLSYSTVFCLHTLSAMPEFSSSSLNLCWSHSGI